MNKVSFQPIHDARSIGPSNSGVELSYYSNHDKLISYHKLIVDLSIKLR